MFRYPELEANIGAGETSTSAKLYFDEINLVVDVTGEYSRRWKRKEVDGRLTTDLPLETVSFTMPESQIPEGIARENWISIRFLIDDVSYKVKYATGIDPVTFYLELSTEEIDEEEDNGGIVL